MELSDNMSGPGGDPVISYSEVYDNPNYSHIMIGGQPFFILPSGELSDHVPVPGVAEAVPVTPGLSGSQRHIYEPGSSTYRSTSDYDTDSSTFRQGSDRSASDTFPPIYEEIDNKPSTNGHHPGSHHVSPVSGRMRHVPSHLPPTRVSPPQSQLYRDPVDTLARPPAQSPDLRGHWPPAHPASHNSLSPRRPQTQSSPKANSSIYYYSDTLRRRGAGEVESDSGVSSR